MINKEVKNVDSKIIEIVDKSNKTKTKGTVFINGIEEFFYDNREQYFEITNQAISLGLKNIESYISELPKILFMSLNWEISELFLTNNTKYILQFDLMNDNWTAHVDKELANYRGFFDLIFLDLPDSLNDLKQGEVLRFKSILADHGVLIAYNDQSLDEELTRKYFQSIYGFDLKSIFNEDGLHLGLYKKV